MTKDERRRRADARAAQRAKRSAGEQLQRLDELLGAGQGAAKERARLAEQAKKEARRGV